MDTKYKSLFLKLSTLLGWTNVIIRDGGIIPGVYGTPPKELWSEYGISEAHPIRVCMPNWLTWAGCGPLMVECRVEPSCNSSYAFAVCDYEFEHGEEIPMVKVREKIADHPNADMAMIFAICKAVCLKLERQE